MGERVIYVVHQGYDEETLPIMPLEKGSPFVRMFKNGVRSKEEPLHLEDAPELLNFFRPTSTKGKEHVFFTCHYKSDEVDIALPDVFAIASSSIVSKAFRDVILSVDAEGGHEFIPTKVLNNRGEPVNENEYFHFWCGRRVSTNIPTPRVDQKREEPSGPKFRTTLSNASTAVYSLNDLDLMRYLSRVPIWVWKSDGGTLYFSKEVFSAFKAANLTGLDEFTARGGFYPVDDQGNYQKTKEFVGHIYVDT